MISYALRTLLLATMITLLLGATSQAATVPSRLAGDVSRSPVRTTSSVYAWDQHTREVLLSHNASRSVSPASTMKLLTSAAALAQFGADHRFTTSVWSSGSIDKDDPTRWNGNLWLVGGGDPSLSTAGFARDNYGSSGAGTNIAALVAPVRKLGIRTVHGRIFVVDDELDAVRFVREWKPSFRYEETGALGALTVNQAQLGRWVGSRSSRTPDVHAGEVYRSLLARDGVRVMLPTRSGSLPAGAAEVGSVESRPLRLLLQHMNRASDNFYAEILLKQLGRAVYGPGQGSTAQGRRAGRATLAALGVDVRGLRWVDGSGLAYGNRLTARLLGQALGVGAQAPWAGDWIDSFARSGVTGTIRRRMTRFPYRNRVSAKTGTLRHVSALAGFSTRLGTDDRRYGFVVLTYHANGAQVSYTAARALQDRIAMTLVR
ncbi:MAG: D-alanyl-D-alanine carboxypeptidase [Thermoleophilia bacterium]|nr:D-alanyl-D-alanine carboxypeptidase [Thermoleophilia bacterium]